MMQNLIDREHVSIMQTYKRLPIEISHAQGCRVYDKSGKTYLDFLAGIAVNALGHSHPKIIDAAIAQMKKYMHVSNYFYQEPQILLAEKLKNLSGFDKVFFSNSGTEAMEGALKLARRWGNLNSKKMIVAFSGGFHGRTYGALSIMDKPLYKDGMGPFLPDTVISEYNNIHALEELINPETAAVVLEFIQGEGGIVEASKPFVEAIFNLREKFKFLVIADEIQAGIGRTGKLFAYEHYGVKPDVVTMAKGLGGGLPLGGLLIGGHLSEIWGKGMHGTTYGGNAVACATGLVVIDELQNGLLENINETGNYFHNKLSFIKSKHTDKVAEVRGRGLMKGLLLKFDASLLVNSLLENGVLSNAASGTVLRLVPPLIVSKSEIDEFTEKLDKSLGAISL